VYIDLLGKSVPEMGVINFSDDSDPWYNSFIEQVSCTFWTLPSILSPTSC
jgi:hypothetical protein